MIKAKSRAPLTDIDVGSFSDVSFLLIIFFILTTQIASFKGSVVDIPSGSPPESDQQQKDKPKQLTIYIQGTDIRIGTSDESAKPMNISLEELKARLLAENFYAKTKKDDRFVIVESDDKVPYDVYFKVVMMINEAGGYLCLMEADEGSSSDAKGK